jgi:hypothetical protein
MSEEDDIARATHAASTLEDPLVVETFAALEAAYIAQWRSALLADERETIWLLLQNLEAFRGSFAKYIRMGQVAAARRELAEKARQLTDQDLER